MTLTTTAQEQLAALTSARNPDGGWGYFQGRGSRLEPTSLCLLALAAAGTAVDGSVLARWPREHNLLVDPAARVANATDNAVALLAAQRRDVGGAGEVALALAPALAGVKGKALPTIGSNGQDNAIQGWPWVADTFSWAEPTAWCVLALKKWGRAHRLDAVAGRVADGERLLFDRVCRNGGWNYGNSSVLGKELPAYVPTTAIGLMALQDWRDHVAVSRSVEFLVNHCHDERSGLSLSLSRIALGLFGVQAVAADLDTALADTWRSAQYLGNLATTALALYAIAGNAESHAAFRL